MEQLVKTAKLGNMGAKEEIIESFTPFILNLSSSYRIYGYEFHDRVSECYKSLLISILHYDITKCNFVSYCVTSIRNTLRNIYRNVNRRGHFEGATSITLTLELENFLKDDLNIEEDVCHCEYLSFLSGCLLMLSEEEREIINWIFYEGGTVKSFSHKYNITYYKADLRKKNALFKLKNILN